MSSAYKIEGQPTRFRCCRIKNETEALAETAKTTEDLQKLVAVVNELVGIATMFV